jgi:lysophospholipase L1-like esterase
VRRFGPDLAIVCLGSNDANGLSDEVFRDGLSRIIDQLDEMGTAILLRTPPPIMEVNPLPRHIWPDDERLQSKVAAVREVAAERELPFVDTYAIWHDAESARVLDMAMVMVDETHTNGAGHQRVAEELHPAFGLPAPAWVNLYRAVTLNCPEYPVLGPFSP